MPAVSRLAARSRGNQSDRTGFQTGFRPVLPINAEFNLPGTPLFARRILPVMHLTRRLNRPQSRRLGCLLTTRTNGRPWRQLNYLALACRILATYVRSRERTIKREPHLHGPHANSYLRDTVQMDCRQREIDAALFKVYGPPKPEDPPAGPGVWTRRYFLDPQTRGFRKWFREQYGS